MSISLTAPLGRAWNRMVAALFKPFDLGKWFVVGFTAFLAELTEAPFGGGGGNGEKVDADEIDDFDAILDIPYRIWDWLTYHPGWSMLIALGLIILIAIVVLLFWLSSRGKFMFLDNVIHNRSKVTQPWREYKKSGNSVFFWQLGFVAVCIVLVLASLTILFIILVTYRYDLASSSSIFSLIVWGTMAILLLICLTYVAFFLNNFVIPLMYKNRLPVLEGWKQFLHLFKRYPLWFILAGLFVLFLHIVVIITIIIGGLFTCCLGFIILLIPYINSVVLLPVSYTFRVYGVEFLEQFGAEYKIFPDAENSVSAK